MPAVEPAVKVVTLEENIACVTLNRPKRLNAIDGSLINGVDDALDMLSGGDFRVAILTGAGRGFCAGADLSGTGQPWTKPKPPRARPSRPTTTLRSAWLTCSPGFTSCPFR
jgi:enoyl-CoA hydratase/carnithine racemase